MPKATQQSNFHLKGGEQRRAIAPALFFAQLQAAVGETQTVVKFAIDGDLTHRIPLEGKSGDLETLCRGVNSLLASVSNWPAPPLRVLRSQSGAPVAVRTWSPVSLADNGPATKPRS